MTDATLGNDGQTAPLPAQERYRRLGDLVVDRETRCVLRDGQAMRLEPRVFALLAYFMDNPGREISRQELGQRVWNGVHVVDEAIQRAISVLRQALGDTPKQGLHIQTTVNGGYRLVSEVSGVQRQKLSALGDWRPLAVAGLLGLLLGVTAMSWLGGERPAYAPEAPALNHETPNREAPDAVAPRAP